jgi:hypothetical protein
LIEIYKIDELLNLLDESGCINGSVTIRGGHISEIKSVKKIKGDLFFFDTLIESLGELEIIEGSLSFWNKYNKIRIQSLENIKVVKRDVYLRFSTIQSLGNLEYVGRTLNLRDTNIHNLSVLKKIGKDLFLPMKYKSIIDFSHIELKGKVKYWNDSKHLSSTLETTKQLVTSELQIPNWKFQYIISHEQVKSENNKVVTFYNYFKESFFKGIYLDVKGETNYLFTLLLEIRDTLDYNKDYDTLKVHFKNLSDHYPVLRHYTTRWIIPLLESKNDYLYLKDLVLDSKNEFIIFLPQYFWILEKTQDSNYDSNFILNNISKSILTNYGLNNLEDVTSIFRDRLKNNINHNELLDFRKFIKKWKTFDSISINKKVEIEISKITTYFEKELRESENELRVNKGLPKIGEGWISETELYYSIKTHFPNYKVYHHGKPKWIGRQHLDIYIEELNIGIEYMGTQHYESIDFFGGDESLIKTKERDEIKREKCNSNNCTLLIVNEGYILQELINTIENIISSSKKKPLYIVFPLK